MKSGFITVREATADPDPDTPQPTPFPIRIVQDPPPPPPSDMDVNVPPPPGSIKFRNDNFYESWDKFLALEPNRGQRLSRAQRAVNVEQAEVEGAEGKKVQENAATSWEQAAESCRKKVAAIVEECTRLNQKYRDAIFDLEASAVQRIEAPPWIKRVEDIFDDPQFFIDGATPQDVHQGSGGDCWFLAALMAVSAKKELIDQLCVARDENAGVYGFVFYRDGEWIYEVIDDKLFLRVGDDDNVTVVRDWQKEKKEGMALFHPDEEKLMSQLQRGGEALYFSHCKSSETWLPLIEKAYAKAHGDYYAIEGGYASEAIEDLTGGVGAHINPEDIMDKDRFWREQLSRVNEKYLFGGGSKPNATKGFVGGHAYAVLKTYEEGDLKLLKLRNPWGETEWNGDWSDGSKLWTPEMMTKLNHTFGDDGIFWISYKDFLKHFPSINRVRLFNKDWQVAQQWTSVNVPWTVDYLDTKFQFTISDKCPVVIVLSQPDDRYFYGLSGRFCFSLHFRVYKEGEEDDRYIVRSMHNSGNETVFTRSVSAEIEDLEPGTYNVVFKVTAVRTAAAMTAEESIMKFAVERKEKLLHVGRRFDYAQTKGNLRAMEEANKKQKVSGHRQSSIRRAKKSRTLKQKQKEQARGRKKRIDDAMREKRIAYHEKRRQKEKERQERRRAQRSEGSDGKTESVTPLTEESPVKNDEEADAKAGAEAKRPEAETDGKSGQEASKAKDENEKSDEPATAEAETTLAEDISRLKLQQSRSSSSRTDPVSPLDNGEDDGYESPVEPPEEMEDDDFDWDSEL
ncbi:uncharacterized protein LTR77_006313 [Saxophila tyrrhenica]|uniref:Calpain catalytic domain-containing protein n=1 Tax=Saxophila tyrrhenica TaxID=1690608 RepID=A0AAV9P7J7_9PEZI|nr:hypothetical protein LTR77_006313 [Saxophila tyrrhenica]